MAPQLESEDEISEIEEVTGTFLSVSAKNSPLIERKETTNMGVNCGNSNFQKDVGLTKCESCDNKISSNNNGSIPSNQLDIDLTDKSSAGHLNITNHGEIESSTIHRVPSTSDENTEEDQENIRPEKLKAKNKLNLKLNLKKQSDDKVESGTTTGFSATLNLPSPSKSLGSVDKPLSKVKRDKKMRVKMSNRKEKVSVDKNNKKNDKNGSKENVMHNMVGNASEKDANVIDSGVQLTPDHESKTDKSEIIDSKDSNPDSACSKNLCCAGNHTDEICDVNSDTSATISSASETCDCDCLERATPAIDEMIKKSTVLRKSSSDNKLAKNSRRRGSLPSPPLETYSIKESVHRVRKESGSFEEEQSKESTDKDEDTDDFVDEEEEEIIVLFKQSDGCDDQQESEDEENSWSPISPMLDGTDVETKLNLEAKRTSISSSKPQPPVLEEENGKIKVTAKFMEDLIRFYKTPITAGENGGYCGGNGGVGKLPSRTVIQILERAKMLFIGVPSLVDIEITNKDSLNICGDIHGQFFDLLNIFENVTGFPSPDNKYLFNGDFVDRGVWSVEVMIVLLGFKLLLPDCFFLVRGNHEAEEVNRVYGFENEVLAKYDAKMFQRFQRVFEWLPVSHCVNESILVMHGGIPCSTSPYLAKQDKISKSRKVSFDCETHSLSNDNAEKSNSTNPYPENETIEEEEENVASLDDIRDIRRGCQVPREGVMCDLLWADPQDENGVAPNSRGYSSVFGPDVTKQFLSRNNLKYIVRSHECVQYGFDMCHDDTVITVFSAPNYCDRHGNKGAVCVLHGDDISMPEFRKFDAIPHPKVDRHKYSSIYMKFGLC